MVKSEVLLVPDIGNTAINSLERVPEAGFGFALVPATCAQYVGGTYAKVGIPGCAPCEVHIKRG